jgi:hypothetical protein
MNPNIPTARHSREGGNPAIQTAREADNISVLSRFAGGSSINWIPAFSGMTLFLV